VTRRSYHICTTSAGLDLHDDLSITIMDAMKLQTDYSMPTQHSASGILWQRMSTVYSAASACCMTPPRSRCWSLSCLRTRTRFYDQDEGSFRMSMASPHWICRYSIYALATCYQHAAQSPEEISTNRGHARRGQACSCATDGSLGNLGKPFVLFALS
jgi:hypothetical protein